MKKSQLKYILVLFLTAIIWGFAFPFQLQGGNALGAFWFNAIRYAIGALSLVPVILIFERERRDAAKLRRTLCGGAACGVILFAATTLQQLGMQATQSSAKTGFITGLYMIFVPFCGIFMHRRVRPEAWMGAAVAVLGLYFVSFQSGDTAFQPGDLILDRIPLALLFIGELQLFLVCTAILGGFFACTSCIEAIRIHCILVQTSCCAISTSCSNTSRCATAITISCCTILPASSTSAQQLRVF